MLPATFPFHDDSQNRRYLDAVKLIHSNPNEILIHKLSKLQTQVSVQEILKEFAQSKTASVSTESVNLDKECEQPGIQAYATDETVTVHCKKVLMFIADMQETSKCVINHLRILIEQSENTHLQNKLYVVLLHFPPSMLSKPCYPALFLHGWNHLYLDAIGRPIGRSVHVKDWLDHCCFENSKLPRNAKDALHQLLDRELKQPNSTAALLSSSVATAPESHSSSLSSASSLSDKIDILTKLLEDETAACKMRDIFLTYWDAEMITDYLDKASYSIYKRESSLSMSDALVSDFHSKFLDFLGYIVTFMNAHYALDQIVDPLTPAEVSHLAKALLPYVGPYPALSQLRQPFTPTTEFKQIHPFCFPFFMHICNHMEQIVKECRNKARLQVERSHNTNFEEHLWGYLTELMNERLENNKEVCRKGGLLPVCTHLLT